METFRDVNTERSGLLASVHRLRLTLLRMRSEVEVRKGVRGARTFIQLLRKMTRLLDGMEPYLRETPAERKMLERLFKRGGR